MFKDEKVKLIEPEEVAQAEKQRKLRKLKEELSVRDSQETTSLPEKNVTLQITGADKVHEMGYKGQGVVIAVLDSGVAKHEDFGNRLTFYFNAAKKLVGLPEFHDGHGHGTHVASIAAGDGRFTGLAPAAEIWAINVFELAFVHLSDIVRAINIVVEMARITGKKVVVNMSLGAIAVSSWKHDPVAVAVEKAIQKGLYVVIAAGNSGPRPYTIDSPGIAPNAITVASYDDKKTEDLSDDEIAKSSSRGPVPNLPLLQSLLCKTCKLKPDIAMPGVNIWAANKPGSQLDRLAKKGEYPITKDGKYIALSGTSMAAPAASGAVALILSANPNLTPKQVRELLMKHTIKLEKIDPTDGKPYNHYDQGAGLPNIYEAVKEALSMKQEKS